MATFDLQNNMKDLLPLRKIKEIADLTPPRSKRVWGRVINQIYSNKCLISGQSISEACLERHHLFNVYDFSHLQLCPFNGVLITRELHLMFHRLYGQNVTASNFKDFIDILYKTPFKKYSERLFVASIWVNDLDKIIKEEFL